MFHIKDDKRSRRSAELIVYGMKQCLERKSFEDITVTDIQKASTVGRATFYRLFDRTDDILAYSCDIVIRGILKELSGGGQVTAKTLSIYTSENADLLELVIKSRREYILYNCILGYQDELMEIMKIDSRDSCDRYFITILTAVIMGIFGAWAKGGKKETAEELDKAAVSAFKRLAVMYED